MGQIWLVSHFLCITLIRYGLRRIMLLEMHLEISFKVCLASTSLDGVALCIVEVAVIILTLCDDVIVLVILLCLEILRLGLGDVHIRRQTCSLVEDLDVDLICHMDICMTTGVVA